MALRPKTYIVEHLDPELGPWSALEYQSIAVESAAAGASFCLTSVSPDLSLPKELIETPALVVECRGVEEIYEAKKAYVCLLDPSATTELSPDDAAKFDVFLFGGILGRCSRLRGEIGVLNIWR